MKIERNDDWVDWLNENKKDNIFHLLYLDEEKKERKENIKGRNFFLFGLIKKWDKWKYCVEITIYLYV